jgi:protein-disulfide isomerase/uncharacterized membrane protein
LRNGALCAKEKAMTDSKMANSDKAMPAAPPKGLGVIFVAYILLVLVGIISSWHLAEVFYQTHIAPEAHDSFCNISESMNCDKVALHDDFSVFLGTPVAIWAMAGYAFVALLAALALLHLRRGFGQGFLFLFGLLFVAVSLYLVYAMHFIIGSWCIVCLGIDVINLALFGLSVAVLRVGRRGIVAAIAADFRSLLSMPLHTVALFIVGPGLLVGAHFSGQRMQGDIAQELDARAQAEQSRLIREATGSQVIYVSGQDEKLDEKQWSPKTKDTPTDQACRSKAAGDDDVPLAIHVGTAKGGQPWKGAAAPVLEIHEFTDFECPHCRTAHMMVSQLVSTYPDKLRVYHRHLPLDHNCNPSVTRPFHPRACELSRVAVCAGRQGRFFEMADYLFHNAQQIRTEKMSASDIAHNLALDLGKFECCMNETDAMDTIKADMQEASRRNLRGTPAFVVGDQVYYGKIPEEALKGLGVSSQAPSASPEPPAEKAAEPSAEKAAAPVAEPSIEKAAEPSAAQP